MMKFCNKNGVFSNYDDTEEGLREALKMHFEHVEDVRVVGRVAWFVARRLIQNKE